MSTSVQTVLSWLSDLNISKWGGMWYEGIVAAKCNLPKNKSFFSGSIISLESVKTALLG